MLYRDRLIEGSIPLPAGTALLGRFSCVITDVGAALHRRRWGSLLCRAGLQPTAVSLML